MIGLHYVLACSEQPISASVVPLMVNSTNGGNDLCWLPSVTARLAVMI